MTEKKRPLYERVWVHIKGTNDPKRYKRGWRKLPVPPSARKLGRLAVAAARSDLGYAEHPAGSNLQKYGKFWEENGVAWCGLAVAYWWHKAGFNVTKDLALKIDYVPQLVELAKDKKNCLAIIHPRRVRPGDAVAYDFPRADGVADHTGLFERWISKGDGTFYALEGNTAVGNDAAGGRVMRRERHISQVQAFIRKLPG